MFGQITVTPYADLWMGNWSIEKRKEGALVCISMDQGVAQAYHQQEAM